MALRPPSGDDLQRLAKANYFDLAEDETKDFRELIEEILPTFDQLDRIPLSVQPVIYGDRDSGYRPSRQEDPLNAIVRKCLVKGARSGKLAGKTVGLKDSICVAGIPMECGSRVMQGYVPDIDATIVTRLLDAGAEIVAKLNMDDFGLSGIGDTSASGPILNPHDPRYLAGGSSGGPTAAVVHGDVDIAIGGDQGGSIRVPAAWCGAVGLKPTYGLVPYTGVVPIENTLDHVGPIARTVEDVALTLEVIAGKDPLDPRQPDVIAKPTATILSQSVSGTRIGIVAEGFGLERSDPAVDAVVRKALRKYQDLGAIVEEVSIPDHRGGLAILFGVLIEGMAALIQGEGQGYAWEGFYHISFMETLGARRRDRAKDLPPTVKLLLVLGSWLHERHFSRFYAKAQNLRRALRTAYDDVLERVDVLAMPTTPVVAYPVIFEADRKDWVRRGWGVSDNAAPFDATGHPALSLPCGKAHGLPVGLMLIGRHFHDSTLMKVGHAFEQRVNWKEIEEP